MNAPLASLSTLSHADEPEQYEINLTRDPSFFTPEELQTISSLAVEDDGFVRLSELAFKYLGEQTQYVSRYFYSWDTHTPHLTVDLRTDGDDEYDARIHRDDVVPFLTLLRAYRWESYLPCS